MARVGHRGPRQQMLLPREYRKAAEQHVAELPARTFAAGIVVDGCAKDDFVLREERAEFRHLIRSAGTFQRKPSGDFL